MIDYTLIETQIQRIKGKVGETYDIAEAKGAEIPATKNIDNLPATVASITGGSGGAYQIVVGELPDTVVELYDGATLLDTKTITNTKITFDITTPKTYTIKAIQNAVEVWTQNIEVGEIGIYICKSGKPLTDYTKEELSTLCRNKMISTMFSLKDKWKFTQVGSIANNDLFIADIIEKQDFEAIRFRSVDSPTITFAWNPQFSYLTALDATTWATTYSNNGGYKYTDLRRQMQLTGEETWSQATSLKPDDNLDLVGGIFLSEFKYSDTGLIADIYDYDKETDTMSIASGLYTGTEANVRTNTQFVKGYFKNVGTLSEEDFNNGYYYTFASNLYTTATTWDGSTTYYGFYEFLQEDGIYANAFSSLQGNLIRFDDYSSAGGTQTTFVSNTQDYFNIPSVEEITGINRDTTLFSGLSGTTINAYNIQGEGTKKPAYDTFDIQAIGRVYWTRSTHSNGTYGACAFSGNGAISNIGVDTAYRVRVGFLFGPSQTPTPEPQDPAFIELQAKLTNATHIDIDVESLIDEYGGGLLNHGGFLNLGEQAYNAILTEDGPYGSYDYTEKSYYIIDGQIVAQGERPSSINLYDGTSEETTPYVEVDLELDYPNAEAQLIIAFEDTNGDIHYQAPGYIPLYITIDLKEYNRQLGVMYATREGGTGGIIELQYRSGDYVRIQSDDGDLDAIVHLDSSYSHNFYAFEDYPFENGIPSGTITFQVFYNNGIPASPILTI